MKPKRFAEFWEAYPSERRANPDECEQIWASKNLDEDADKIIAAVNVSKANNPQWQQEGGRYIPGSVRYLESDCWEGTTEPEKKPLSIDTYLCATETYYRWIPDELLARFADETERAEYERNKAENLKNGYTEPDWDNPKIREKVKDDLEWLDRKTAQTSNANEV